MRRFDKWRLSSRLAASFGTAEPLPAATAGAHVVQLHGPAGASTPAPAQA